MKSKKTAPNISALSRQHGICRQTLRDWRAAGIDITDPAAIEKRRALKQRQPDTQAAASDTGESYSEARRRREIAAANKMEIIAAKEAGKLIDLAEVETAFAQVGAEFRSRLLGMRGTLVTELEGKTPEGIYQVLDLRFGELLTAIHKLSKP
jgi:transposase-like protein